MGTGRRPCDRIPFLQIQSGLLGVTWMIGGALGGEIHFGDGFFLLSLDDDNVDDDDLWRERAIG